jgi:DNA-binding NtrC family response regulator
VSKNATDKMMAYYWPGNIRELENAIEHAFVLCRDRIISERHLPPDVIQHTDTGGKQVNNCLPAQTPQSADEKEAIMKALSETDWNKAKTARLLGMSRPTLYKKIQEYKIQDS